MFGSTKRGREMEKDEEGEGGREAKRKTQRDKDRQSSILYAANEFVVCSYHCVGLNRQKISKGGPAVSGRSKWPQQMVNQRIVPAAKYVDSLVGK